MAKISDLIELSERVESRSVKWKKTSNVHYEALIDGVLVEVNKALPSCRINGGKWQSLWAGSLAHIKVQAIRLTQRAADRAKAARSIRWDEDGISAAGHGAGE